MDVVTKIYSKVLRKWNYVLNDLNNAFGINEQLFKRSRGARIVIYHGICRNHHTRFNSIFLTEKTFEAHLQFYKKYFHAIALNDYYNQQFDNQRFNICITFDDGFANNYKYVLPLMTKYKIPVTFFVTAIRNEGYDILWNDILSYAQKYGPQKIRLMNDEFYKDKSNRYVSTSNEFLKDILQSNDFEKKAETINYFEQILSFRHKKKGQDYWLQMTKEEIKLLSQSPLSTIGCHGYFHNDLSQISLHKASDEIIRSKQFIEISTGKEIDAFAFPYGAYSREVINAAKSAGFTKLLAMDFLFPENYSDPVMKERLTVNPYISVNNQMIAIINGRYK
jgi:peptidoglycan/xylan/chitin deacetylase (PgdA/CDA1 family)